MTTPGVGPTTALTYKAAVDDPQRFKSFTRCLHNDIHHFLGENPGNIPMGTFCDKGTNSSPRTERDLCCFSGLV
ncbi:MAG: transposase [Gammaproteobacteria bacterium]|nr:transposase [Gammaproteobacteria bacterium]